MAALLAAALYALCPFVLFYNRIALLDGLVATCGAGALFFALELSRHARTRDALALALCLAAGMLTKIFAVSMLLLPVLAVVAAWPAQRRAVRRKALPAALLGLLPLALLLLTPQGGGLLSATHTHAHAVAQPLAVIVRQLATWAQALWLYLTLPVLALAVLGLWTMRHERAARLLGPWALLGGLPPALVPGAFLAPRYFLYIAVPILLLSALGLLAVAVGLSARLRHVPLWLLVLALCRWGADLDQHLGAGSGPAVELYITTYRFGALAHGAHADVRAAVRCQGGRVETLAVIPDRKHDLAAVVLESYPRLFCLGVLDDVVEGLASYLVEGFLADAVQQSLGITGQVSLIARKDHAAR